MRSPTSRHSDLKVGIELSYVRSNPNHVGDAGDPYTGYDRFGRTVDMPWTTTGTTPDTLDRVQYGYDRAGNRTWRRDLAATDGGQDKAYGYDGLYQVKEAARGTLNLNQTAIGGIPEDEERFDYDPTGNWTRYRTAADGAETLDQTRVSNRDNQTTQLDGSSDGIAHDRAGNALLLPPGPGGDWSTHLKLTWDGWNRLVSVKTAAGASVADYQYDGTFRRVRRVLADGETIDYFYNDQWKCLEERSTGGSSGAAVAPSSSYSSSSFQSSSSATLPSSSSSSNSSSSAVPASTSTQFVWGARPGHRDELILRERDTTGSGTYDQRHWCLMDYFNPTALVADDASVVERYRFSAFGVRTPMAPDWSARSASAYDFDFAFQGQFEDPETGYLDYGFRYYSPALGRWTARDPIAEQGGNNVYAFVRNSPPAWIDLLGKSPKSDCEEKPGYSWVIKDPDPGFSVNGCSAPLGPAKDNPVGFGCSFLSACNSHDMCYQDCDRTKSDCDSSFLRDMDMICFQCSYTSPHIFNLSLYLTCRFAAETYYLAVSAAGGPFYEDGQNLRCECRCDDPQSY